MKDQPNARPFFLSGLFVGPPDWRVLFGNEHPIELEIGMGRSHFLFERAGAAPERNHVGIEWKGRWVKQANLKIAREKTPNVWAIHGNAWILAPSFFGPDSLSNITLNFPDPWWKKKHHKRRIVNDAFVEVLASRLKEGGTFFLQSDVYSLFEEYLERLEANPNLQNINGPKGMCATNPMNARSHREKKCIEVGIPVYRALLVKVS
jgi:tRNA (guanine-N7-)-methyltransferase